MSLRRLSSATLPHRVRALPTSRIRLCNRRRVSILKSPACRAKYQQNFYCKSTEFCLSYSIRVSLICSKCSLVFASHFSACNCDCEKRLAAHLTSFGRLRIAGFYGLYLIIAIAKFRIFFWCLALQLPQSVFDVHFPASPVVLKCRSFPFL